MKLILLPLLPFFFLSNALFTMHKRDWLSETPVLMQKNVCRLMMMIVLLLATLLSRLKILWKESPPQRVINP